MNRSNGKSSLSPAAVVLTVLSLITETFSYYYIFLFLLELIAAIFSGKPSGDLSSVMGTAFGTLYAGAAVALAGLICEGRRLKRGNGRWKKTGILFIVLDVLLMLPAVSALLSVVGILK